MSKRKAKGYRIALRPNEAGFLDDVVVKDVAMFRAEDMGDWWWLCCYLEDGNRITWHMSKKAGRVVMDTIEYPHDVTYEDGSMVPATSKVTKAR